MTRLTRVHHVNFLFRDLGAAVARIEAALGVGPFEYEDLEERGARTARVKVGETWIVLVSPTRPDSVPAQHLSERGEGFFMLSFGVDDLDAALADVAPGSGRRTGLAGWKVADLPVDPALGVHLQLTDDPPSANAGKGISGIICGPNR